MGLKANIDGVLRDITSLYTNINGSLRKIGSAFTNDGGELKQVFCGAAEYVTYGVRISLSDSNPESAVVYTDDAVGMTAQSSAWDEMPIFRKIKPCVLKNGKVNYYLERSDFTKKADGTLADVSSGNDGDVMIEFPLVGFKIQKSGGYVYIQITNEPNKDGFSYEAFRRYSALGNVIKDKLYIGAYLGYTSGDTLRSLSGYSPSRSITMDAFRSYARNMGTGYGLMSFYPATLLQCLYLIRQKSLDAQTTCGFGASNTDKVRYNTGGTKHQSMFYAGSATYPQNKVFGIEDLWGNQQVYLDGIYTDASRRFIIADNHENSPRYGGARAYDSGFSSNCGSYMSAPQGTNALGFLPAQMRATHSTYFCDAPSVFADRIAVFGGTGDGMYQNGIFTVGLCISTDAANYPYSNTSARLMYI